MARLNINISDGLNEQMRKYIKENNLTITTFLHLAISKYIETQEQTKKWQTFFTELFKTELKRIKEK
jgi:molybdopterin-guanine dinucleotide biosynthesis protein A